jgi:hypothetical protein
VAGTHQKLSNEDPTNMDLNKSTSTPPTPAQPDLDGNVTAFQFIRYLGVIPMSVENPCTRPSNSEIMRWLNQGSVLINGTRPKAKDVIDFPVTQLVFFPKGKRRTTVL